jgi:hypothetical protein
MKKTEGRKSRDTVPAKAFSNIISNSRRYSNFLKCMRCHWHRMHVCMWGHWHCMHGACSVIYTAGNLVPEFGYPTLKKYINLKGLPNKKFLCMRCHWHRMHDFCVRKLIISRRIQSRIQKGFRAWIRGSGQCCGSGSRYGSARIRNFLQDQDPHPDL